MAGKYTYFECVILLLCIGRCDAGCSHGARNCQWIPWKSWSPCSSTCGGGYQTRSRDICCKSSLDFDACLIDCHLQDDSSQNKQCNTNCLNGGRYSHGCVCVDGYHDYCCSSRCTAINNCKTEYCTSSWNSRCRKCEDEGVDAEHSIFWPDSARLICQETCSWKRNWCWPGVCSDHLASSCNCSSDFRPSVGPERLCKLNKKPDLVTCRMGVESSGGLTKNSTNVGGGCLHEGPTYIKFQPAKLSYNFEFEFHVNITENKPKHINTSTFGIVGAEITLVKTLVNQMKQNVTHYLLSTMNGCTQTFSKDSPFAGSPVTCSREITSLKLPRLKNGERLCLSFLAQGGGYLQTINFSHIISNKHYYLPTQSTKEVCLRYDDSPPEHCMCKKVGCTYEPVQFSNRVTSDSKITVRFEGWDDPYPIGGQLDQASGIKEYTVGLHEVKELNGTTLDMAENDLEHTTTNSLKNITFFFPRQPALYAITIEVLDVAENLRKARRFILFDNSSSIKQNHGQKLWTYTASKNTNYTWQTHHGNICISWRGRYYNSYQKTQNLLRQIAPDYHHLYNGMYEQLSGSLPVSGTPNVDGIVDFKYAWTQNNGRLTNESVPNFLNESFCKDFGVQDGDTYTFFIKPIDIMGHRFNESVVVNIDSSVPDINNIWLVKDAHKQLYVHNSTDLLKMSISFDVMDMHSGILSIKWHLGTTDGGSDLGMEFLKLNQLDKKQCPPVVPCYCPKIGKCEYYSHTASFKKLVNSKGQHNREYYLTIIATNNAKLVNVKRIDILVDDSPPEEGVVIEGSLGNPDIDYISGNQLIVSWHGFIDHESGIRLYRVGIYHRCLSLQELDYNENSNLTTIYETTYRSIQVTNVWIGKFYSSVVAYNNAMQPSIVICSDGFTRDSTAPSVTNVVLSNAKTSEYIACYNKAPWFVLENLTRVPISNTDTCLNLCNKTTEMKPVSALPIGHVPYNDTSFADDVCQRNDFLQKDRFVYIPTSNIVLSWNIIDAESQIQDIFVGYASDKTQLIRPDVRAYVATYKTYRYSQTHSGLDTGVPFFIMIKAVNKAGLETITPFGPVIIDETPPFFIGKVFVDIQSGKVFVSWKQDTFEDTEQRGNITTILFRIATDAGYITPFLQTPITTDCPTSTHVFCISFPLYKLQLKDNESGRLFHFELHVYNIAGLFTTVKTDTFRIPSLFPPGHGLVFDKDPTDLHAPGDIDFRLTSNISCVEWHGFRHHQNISIEIGIGTTPRTDNIVPLKEHGDDNISNIACIRFADFKTFQKYYFVVRANCSGGSTTTASDGFVIINPDYDDRKVRLSFGQDLANSCKTEHDFNVSLSSNGTIDWTISEVFDVGKDYSIHVQGIGIKNVEITSQDLIFKTSQTKASVERIFTPFTTKPKVVLTTKSDYTFLEKIKIFQEHKKIIYLSSNNSVAVFWKVDSMLRKFVTRYDIALLKLNCEYNTVSKDCLEIVKPYHTVGKTENTALTNIAFIEGTVYYIALKLCFQYVCLTPQMSNALVIQSRNPKTGKITAQVSQREKMGYKINISFDSFLCQVEQSESNPYAIGYRWSIMLDMNRQIMEWRSATGLANTSVILIEDIIKLPVYIHRRLFVCIQGFCQSGSNTEVCQKLNIIEHPNKYEKETLYEMNSNIADLSEIKNLVFSTNIGKKLSVLHENEMNFCKPNTKVVGVIPNSGERTIDWYLLSGSTYIPTNCESDANCVQQMSTLGGIVVFKRMILSPDKVYYVCAYSNITVINRELYEEQLNEFEVCGDGFIVDNDPPKRGSVTIYSTKERFLNSKNEMTIFWDGFSDFDNDFKNRYTSTIRSYSIAIGSHPEGQDVLPYIDVGQTRSYTVQNLKMENGHSYFATVKAFDFVDHESISVSKEVTVDVTPPLKGLIHIGHVHGHISVLHSHKIQIHWNGFDDPESGITSFMIGIGSDPDSTDIIALHNVEGTFVDIKNYSKFVDGHMYYATIVAINNAGLSTRAVSLPVIVDTTPPTKGFVNEGHKENKSDIDYQIDTRSLHAYWNGFDDPHSGLKFYSVGVGTFPGLFDVEALTENGLRTEHTWRGLYTPGVRYYVTVEACNGVGLCNSVSSDGVILDNSPPVPGLIHIGLSDRHESFVSHNSTLSVQWIGFQDPHSNLDHFEWCIGTKRYTCDVLPMENILLSRSVTKTGLDLPLGKNLYTSVRAYNNIGLFSTRSSDKFRVDITPPEIILKPEFITKDMVVSHRNGTQWDNSLIRISWKFDDKESPIISHEIQLRINSNGHSVIETMTTGSENKITIRLRNETLLKSGDKYTAWVTACNAAGLCCSSNTNELLIDTTPPALGGFRNPMRWQTLMLGNKTHTILNLAWYGFTDLESEIDRYMVAVSRNYSGFELSNGTKEFIASNLGEERQSIVLSQLIESGESIILSIWAFNKVGLRSSIGRVTVTLAGTNKNQTKGLLEIQRHSCTTHFCNNDCTCAVIGMKCEKGLEHIPCVDISDESFVNVSVNVGDTKTFRILNSTTSSSCLSAFWKVEDDRITDIIRFEWSIGSSNGILGDVFDVQTENPWKDVGRDTTMTYCLTKGRQFIHSEMYVVYVKAWYSKSTFAVFKSNPVLIDLTASNVRKGSHIRESVDGCKSDTDFLQTGVEIYICWDRVFSDAQGKILFYELIGGTLPYGADFLDLQKLETDLHYVVNGSSMNAGTRYFFTVMATNEVGFVTTMVSDGIMVDNEIPTAGVVFNTAKNKNVHFQPSTDSFGISFHGFDDHMSFIKYYKISLIEVHSNRTILKKSIGICNSVFLESLKLKHKHSYKASVYAVDAAGHISDVSYSPILAIDSTPPEGFDCSVYEEVSVFNMSNNSLSTGNKKVYAGEANLNEGTFYKFFIRINTYPLVETILFSVGKAANILYLAKNTDHTSEIEYNFIQNHAEHTTIKIEIDGISLSVEEFKLSKCSVTETSTRVSPVRVRQIAPSIFSVFNMAVDQESKIKSIQVGAGTTKGGFQIMPLSPFSTRHHSTFEADLQHRNKVYVTSVVENHAGLKSVFKSDPVIVDFTPPVISDLHADLFFHHSYIEQTYFNIDSFENVTNDTKHMEQNITSTLPVNTDLDNTQNGSIVNVTKTHSWNYTEKVPVLEAVLNMSWSVVDEESGIKACFCAVGSRKGSFDVREWQVSEDRSTCSFLKLAASHGTILYPSVRCINSVELLSVKHHDGLVESFEMPNITTAKITMLPENYHSNQNLKPNANFQSDSSKINFYWQGFRDFTGIHHYETKLVLNGFDQTQWTNAELRNYHQFDSNLQASKEYTTLVRAVNNGNVASLPINGTLYIEDSNQPSKTGKQPTIIMDADKCAITWQGTFRHTYGSHLLYQVTIGSQKGYADLMKATLTSAEYADFDCENKPLSYYVTITAFTPTGRFIVYRNFVNVNWNN